MPTQWSGNYFRRSVTTGTRVGEEVYGFLGITLVKRCSIILRQLSGRSCCKAGRMSSIKALKEGLQYKCI